jgi:soluble lytic murein transglycosylase-like protein
MLETAQWIAGEIGRNFSEQGLTKPETNIEVGVGI